MVASLFLTICSCQLVWGLLIFFLRQRNKVLLREIVFLGMRNRHFLEERSEITQNICLEPSVLRSGLFTSESTRLL